MACARQLVFQHYPHVSTGQADGIIPGGLHLIAQGHHAVTLRTFVDGIFHALAVQRIQLRHTFRHELGCVATHLIRFALPGIEHHTRLVRHLPVGKGKVHQPAFHACRTAHPSRCHIGPPGSLGLQLRLAVCGMERDTVLGIGLLHKESLVRIEHVVVILRIISLIRPPVPYRDGIVIPQILQVEIRSIGIAHEIPSGILYLVCPMALQENVAVLAVELRIRDLESQRSGLATLENIPHTGGQLACRPVFPTSPSMLGTFRTIIPPQDVTSIILDVLLVDGVWEAEEIPTVGFHLYVDMQVLGIDVAMPVLIALPDDRSPVPISVVFKMHVTQVLTLAPFDHQSRTGIEVGIRTLHFSGPGNGVTLQTGCFLVNHQVFVEVEVLIGFVELHQRPELRPLRIPIIISISCFRHMQCRILKYLSFKCILT